MMGFTSQIQIFYLLLVSRFTLTWVVSKTRKELYLSLLDEELTFSISSRFIIKIWPIRYIKYLQKISNRRICKEIEISNDVMNRVLQKQLPFQYTKWYRYPSRKTSSSKIEDFFSQIDVRSIGKDRLMSAKTSVRQNKFCPWSLSSSCLFFVIFVILRPVLVYCG